MYRITARLHQDHSPHAVFDPSDAQLMTSLLDAGVSAGDVIMAVNIKCNQVNMSVDREHKQVGHA